MPPHKTIDKFLTPEAMVTPGVAGSMSMMMGNALHYNFNIPNGWAVLILSFVFGLLVVVKSGPVWRRGIFYVLNSLVIFCVAAGTITLGAGSGGKAAVDQASFIASAYAQPATADLQAEHDRLKAQFDALFAEISAKRAGENVTQQLSDVEKVLRQLRAVDEMIAAQKAKTSASVGKSAEKPFFSPLKF